MAGFFAVLAAGEPQKSERDALLGRLGERRRRRMQSGRPIFDLTASEVRSSTEAAIRLAKRPKPLG